MNEDGQQKPYDLGERTLLFAKRVRALFKLLPRTLANEEDGRQLIRSSGSVGANYIEANEGLGKKDFLMRMKIARREAEETAYWLRLIDTGLKAEIQTECDKLAAEAWELVKILSAIIRKCE